VRTVYASEYGIQRQRLLRGEYGALRACCLVAMFDARRGGAQSVRAARTAKYTMRAAKCRYARRFFRRMIQPSGVTPAARRRCHAKTALPRDMRRWFAAADDVVAAANSHVFTPVVHRRVRLP